jgi:type I restriction enzyme R subunit
MAKRERSGRRFTVERRQWLEAIRDYIVAGLVIETDDFDYVPFAQHGGVGKAFQVFGRDLTPLLQELNTVLAA